MGPNDSKTIYFARHAKDNGMFRGGWSTKPLVHDGRVQADCLAENIFQIRSTMNIGTVISSDLVRAVQTATPVAQKLGLDIIQHNCWRETNNGLLAGMHNSEAKKLYPGLFWSTLEYEEHYPSGESPKEFYERIKTAFEELKDAVLTDKIPSNVIVFTHSGVISVVYSLVRNRVWSNRSRHFDIPFTSVHAFNINESTISRYL